MSHNAIKKFIGIIIPPYSIIKYPTTFEDDKFRLLKIKTAINNVVMLIKLMPKIKFKYFLGAINCFTKGISNNKIGYATIP